MVVIQIAGSHKYSRRGEPIGIVTMVTIRGAPLNSKSCYPWVALSSNLFLTFLSTRARRAPWNWSSTRAESSAMTTMVRMATSQARGVACYVACSAGHSRVVVQTEDDIAIANGQSQQHVPTGYKGLRYRLRGLIINSIFDNYLHCILFVK